MLTANNKKVSFKLLWLAANAFYKNVSNLRVKVMCKFLILMSLQSRRKELVAITRDLHRISDENDVLTIFQVRVLFRYFYKVCMDVREVLTI